MFVLTIALLLILAIAYFYEKTVKPANFPPGPKWNPLTGCTPTVEKLAKELGGAHKAFHKLSQLNNSGVIGLKLGRTVSVCVCNDEFVKAVLRGEEFQSRPISFFSSLRSLGTNKGITFTNGEFWKVQRNFLVRHIRNLGFGKQRMDDMIADELSNIMDNLNGNQTEQIGPLLAPSVLNILWTLVAGERMDRDNIRLKNLFQLLAKRAKLLDVSGGWFSSWPWLRFIAPKTLGYDVILKINAEMKLLFMSAISEHYSSWYPGRSDDVMYAFISEMNETKDPSFTDDQLIMICVDIFIAGSQTTSTTLSFVFMCMILYPDIQKKVHEAIDAAYPKGPNAMLPEYKNRHLVPYVEAVLAEVQRCYLVTAITGPRCTTCNTKIGPYDIPKGTTVLMNNYAVNHDPTLWDDPETFRPERFLNQKGGLEIPEFFYPFNIGKRKCLADTLARNCIFTFFAGIMKTYKITLQENSKPLTGIPIPGITLAPEEYKACFTIRK